MKSPWLLFLIIAGAMAAGCTGEMRLSTSSPVALRSYQEAVTLYEKFYYREALDSLNRAIAADSSFAMAWARRGMINAELKDREKARRDVARALALSPGTTPPERLLIRMWNDWISYEPAAAASAADSLSIDFERE